MYFKILKRSLKSKKSINFILLVFILLAAMFIAGSVNNLILIAGGLDAYFDEASVDDFVIISSLGGSYENPLESDMELEKYLEENEFVDSFTCDHTVFAGQSSMKKEDGSEFKLNGTVMISSWDIKQQKFFDDDNNQITDIEDGTIYITRREFEENGSKIGDKIYFKMSDGSKMEFTIKGISKDACFGADMMGSHRFIISDNDMNKLLNDSNYMYSRLYSLDLNNVEEYENSYANQNITVLFGDSKATYKITYIMDMITAGIFIMASVLLVIISIVILRFAIVFTVNEEYKEIGIMKAIGIKDSGIRKLYVTKYMLIATLGSLLGFGASIPFSSMLMKPAMRNMVIKTDTSNIILQLVISLLVAFVVVVFAYISTGKIKKFTPMDAIRSGSNGERFKKKGVIKLGGTKKNVTGFMAVNDVFCELRKYLILFFATVVGVWMVVMPINTINTLRSEKIGDWFAVITTDIVITNEGKFNDLISKGEKQGFIDLLEEMQAEIETMGYQVKDGSMELGWAGIKIQKGDKTTKSIGMQGLGTDTDDYVYEEGTAPKYENEVAITHIVAKNIDAKVGDTVTITIKGEEKPFIVTAIYQSMNNMGEGIRFTDEVSMDYTSMSLCFGAQYNFVEDYSDEEKEEIIKYLQEKMPESDVKSFKAFIDSMIGGISDRLVPIKIIMLVIVIIVNILIVMLMQKMFLLRERGEMAMLKSIGFSNKDIIKWQTKRITIVLFLGILVGTITGTPFSQATSGQVFKLMGASKIKFDINPLEVYIMYPLAILIASVVMCMFTMLSVKKITVNDMNEIE